MFLPKITTLRTSFIRFQSLAEPINRGWWSFQIIIFQFQSAEACRNSDSPFRGDGTDFVLSVDGGLVSDNVEILLSETVDTGFKHSDHNTVKIEFRLK